MDSLSLLKYCVPCNSTCCKIDEFIGSPILSEGEFLAIKRLSYKLAGDIEEIKTPKGNKYYIIKHIHNRCAFLGEDNRCKVQSAKPLDCLCYPIKAIYKNDIISNNDIMFIIDPECPASKYLTKDFIEDAKIIAIKSIKSHKKEAYDHWISTFMGWIKDHGTTLKEA